ncbi:hypothetical protein AZ20_1104 [Bordetella bronchiseptica E014]|uniref:hypothetical protein n=1 Tax=Bordetella bronchiseptica TaxID=518 RepID=UPI00049FE7DC|nr:hypothetical protein [Bordetella bronchiseptica]KDC19571.1 hypothetical protein AZ20_1104 [Bordetella bronchiseptica E014]
MDAEKALDHGAWQKIVLYVVPGAIVIISFTLAFDVHQRVLQNEEGRWLAAAIFLVCVVAMGSLLEELAGRFEARWVDGRLYPCLRGLAKWRRTLDRIPGNCPSRAAYVHSLCAVWEQYLELPASPALASVRWRYYENLVIRYRASIALGLASGLSLLTWAAAIALASWSAGGWAGAGPQGFRLAAAGLFLVLAAYLLLIEVPSSCAILHWHRVKLVQRYRRRRDALP